MKRFSGGILHLSWPSAFPGGGQTVSFSGTSDCTYYECSVGGAASGTYSVHGADLTGWTGNESRSTARATSTSAGAAAMSGTNISVPASLVPSATRRDRCRTPPARRWCSGAPGWWVEVFVRADVRW